MGCHDLVLQLATRVPLRHEADHEGHEPMGTRLIRGPEKHPAFGNLEDDRESHQRGNAMLVERADQGASQTNTRRPLSFCRKSRRWRCAGWSEACQPRPNGTQCACKESVENLRLHQ